MNAESLPRYVDRWNFSSSPQPFICRDLSAYSFSFEGDLSHLQDLCNRYLNDPSKGQLDYRPLSPHVVLTFTRTTSLAAENPRYTELGKYPETEAAFWVLTAALERNDRLEFVDRLAWFTPYIFVDNPLAMSDGREIYGFPKEFGWFKLPNDAGDSGPFGLEVLATKTFGTEAIGAQQPLLEVNRIKEGP